MIKKNVREKKRHPAVSWIISFGIEMAYFCAAALAVLTHPFRRIRGTHQRIRLILWLWGAVCAVFLAVVISRQLKDAGREQFSGAEIVEDAPLSPPEKVPDIYSPIRKVPVFFPRNHRMPGRREVDYSVSITKTPFNPVTDLVRIDDSRVWWESDHDHGDTEDDHMIHQSMEIPLRRLIELVCQAGGTLKVQDAYRDTGIHTSKSLHKQGRAIDLTCDELGLEKLAALTWAAGFDWVYHEAPKRGGHHVHASVRPY